MVRQKVISTVGPKKQSKGSGAERGGSEGRFYAKGNT